MQHDFEFKGAAELPRPYDPANYGLHIWRDEDHLPPQAEETATEAVESDAPGAISRAAGQGSMSNKWVLTVYVNGNIGVARYGTTEFISIPTTAWLPFDIMFFAD